MKATWYIVWFRSYSIHTHFGILWKTLLNIYLNRIKIPQRSIQDSLNFYETSLVLYVSNDLPSGQRFFRDFIWTLMGFFDAIKAEVTHAFGWKIKTIRNRPNGHMHLQHAGWPSPTSGFSFHSSCQSIFISSRQSIPKYAPRCCSFHLINRRILGTIFNRWEWSLRSDVTNEIQEAFQNFLL